MARVGDIRARPSGCKSRVIVVGSGLLIILILAITVPIYFWLTTRHSTSGVCDIAFSVPLLDVTSYPNGSLVDHGDFYPPGSYYTVNGTIHGCPCALRPCIRKCCAKNEYMVNSLCEKNPNPSAFDNLPVYKNVKELANVSQNHFYILYGFVCTNGKYMLDPEVPTDSNRLLTDGMINLVSYGTFLDASAYCLETINNTIQTIVCFPETEDDQTKAMFTFYPIGMILSIPFLLATFLVYAVIPDIRNLHGKSLMCHVASLLSAYIALAIVQLGRDAVSSSWCFSLAFIIQFSFLATFFWLNVMCFDIWWVFSGLRPLRGSVKEREHKKFVLYSLYAWGGPLLILMITLIMELVPSIPENFIKPEFGVEKCWFRTTIALLIYFYLPIGILVLLNIVMFATTALRLRAHTKETKVLNSSESRRNDETDKQRYNLYLKLFIVMGVNWVMELVSFAVGGPKSIWFVTDIGNTLQGLLIFLIFVCKRRILRLLNQKLCPQWEIISPTTGSSGSKVSHSRTNSTAISKIISNNPDGLALNPIVQANSEESDCNN